MQFLSGSITNVAEVPVVNVSDIRLRGSAELFKRIFDQIVALIAVVVLAPILLLIAMFIRFDSPGPILFRQHRYGVDGKEIEVWKFRSMSVQENRGPVTQATRNDIRVTRVGAFLRKHSLDELPQFFNVLQGNMSIVGPRPHAVSHNEEYRAKIDGYMLRHKIKPGITGWAQVNGWRGETDTLEKMEGRVRYDLEYIRNWSAWLDIKIILLTVIHVFSGDDAY
jgi:putative colanic acid biosynthesis UDP-glucose lipid carrier transferase